MQSGTRLVWDLPLRIFHWLFAASILAAWGTAKLGFAWMQWHFWIGYEVMGLIVFRLVWGFVGPRHSRFSNFLTGPAAVARYLRGFWSHASEVPVGHNPLGAYMVVI